MKKLIAELDRVFSIYIRCKDADANGIVKCVTCGHRDHWKNMDCGHFVSRKNHSVRWDETNAAPQCVTCNRILGGMPYEFEDYLVDKYGRDEVECLKARGHSTLKLMEWELESMITTYKNRITGLKVLQSAKFCQ